jgi:hypothetical protein
VTVPEPTVEVDLPPIAGLLTPRAARLLLKLLRKAAEEQEIDPVLYGEHSS